MKVQCTWIVVAHQAGARIVEERGDTLKIRETLTTEGPSSVPGPPDSHGHKAPPPRESAREHPTLVFANELADKLRKHRNEGHYSELVLIAAPRFLGVLRNALDQATAAKVRGSLDKDFARMNDRDLIARLEKM